MLEAVGQIGGYVELAAAHVNLALRRLAKRNDSRIEPVHQRTKREKIQLAFLANIQPVSSSSFSPCIDQNDERSATVFRS